MAEYINKEEYCENYCRCSNEHCDRQSCPIWKAPAADVAPVRRGHWIEESGCQICSECGEEHEWDEYRATYCDVCGAEMEVDNG